MIKLILADMDGTLLNSSHQLPEQTMDTIRQLAARGIRFGVASGREYDNIREYFPELADEMIIYLDVLPGEEVERIVRRLREIPGTWIVLCGRKMSYIECQAEKREIIAAIAHNFYENVELTEDICARTKDEQIMEISLFCENGAANAQPAVQLAAKYIAPTNEEGGVIQVLRQRFEL